MKKIINERYDTTTGEWDYSEFIKLDIATLTNPKYNGICFHTVALAYMFGKAHTYQLSKILDVTENTVKNRLKKAEESGILGRCKDDCGFFG